MEASPLTQQVRPEVFQQKVVALYEELFKVGILVMRRDHLLNSLQDEEYHEKPEGYWRELFLLKPDKATLQKILNQLSADDLLHLQVRG